MVCTTCKKDGKLCVFNTFQYYYCETCKEEIKLDPKNVSSDSSDMDLPRMVDFSDADYCVHKTYSFSFDYKPLGK